MLATNSQNNHVLRDRLSSNGSVLHNNPKIPQDVFMDALLNFRTSPAGHPRGDIDVHINITPVSRSMYRIRQNTIAYTASAITCMLRCHFRHANVLCDVCHDTHNAHDPGWATQSRTSSCPSPCPEGHGDVQQNEHQNQGRVIVDIKLDISTSTLDVFESTTMFLVTYS
jgi:hypothetical protein